MKRMIAFIGLLGLLYGCGGAGYLPYAPHALNPQQISMLVTDASSSNGVPPGLVRAVLMAESAGDPSAISIQTRSPWSPARNLRVERSHVGGDELVNSLQQRNRQSLITITT